MRIKNTSNENDENASLFVQNNVCFDTGNLLLTIQGICAIIFKRSNNAVAFRRLMNASNRQVTHARIWPKRCFSARLALAGLMFYN